MRVLVVALALLALGGCKKEGGWKNCTGLYVIDNDRNKNVFEHQLATGEKGVLKYRVVSEGPVEIEYYYRAKAGGFDFEEEQSGFVVLKPSQQLQCINHY